MAKYRNALPQLREGIFITDGGLETTLMFHYGIDLPEFAAFTLLKTLEGRDRLREYFSAYSKIARAHKVGFILESFTWRASSEWGKKLGYSSDDLDSANRTAIELLREIRDEYENRDTKIVISGCIGSKNDGYNPGTSMSEEEAENYHRPQIETFRKTDADFVSALTMTNIEEAVGIARASGTAGMPAVLSFTVETDGKLPSGHTLQEAIETVDSKTDNGPIYYMINCAHPTHFADSLVANEPWIKRIRGVRANASSKSHEELDNSEELDAGNPVEFGSQYKELIDRFNHINILGDCCGTDQRHIQSVCNACLR